MTPTKLIMIGAGGHARVLLSALGRAGLWPDACVAREPPPDAWPAGIAYLGSEDALTSLDRDSVRLVNGIGTVKTTTARRQAFERAKALGFTFASVIDPAAFAVADAVIDEGAQLIAGAVIQTGSRIGANVIVNTRAVVDHDGIIGDHSHIATGAALSGNVTLGRGVHVGTGAAIIHGIDIGDEAVVAAGAVVVRNVAARTLVAGVPARALKAMTPG
ncbi:MAG: NeuD/PglB/VioB family sugar acetyltransferase [Hyphomicrobiaceae bacterium]